MRTLAPALAGLLLSGCVSSGALPPAQVSAEDRDRTECEQLGSHTFREAWRQRSLGGFAFGLCALGLYLDTKGVERTVYRTCMVSRGYELPPEVVVR